MLHNIYIICFGVGVVYTVLSVVLNGLFDFLNFDFDFDFDFDLDFGLDLDFFFLPIRPFTIMSFATVFGAVGLAAEFKITSAMALIPAVVCAWAVTKLLAWIFYVKLPKYETETPREEDALMQRADVVERILPGGYGKISFVLEGNTISGAAKEIQAGQGISRGCKVYIVNVKDNVYYVTEDLELYINQKQN